MQYFMINIKCINLYIYILYIYAPIYTHRTKTNTHRCPQENLTEKKFHYCNELNKMKGLYVLFI